MICRVRAQFAPATAAAIALSALSISAFGADLPQIKLSAQNKVPVCVTPGRLSAYLESRNKKLDPRFETIAADYMRIGEELKIRWDTAFFQMLLETGNLTFTGDVSSKQNNFAGLGATGKHEPGEAFPDVATGVKAHLQHLLMYSGEKIDNAVAERTRKVQEWNVLTEWQKSIDGPMTYTQLAKKWAPGSRAYSSDIGAVADAFYEGLCKAEDPKPEMMALVHPPAAPGASAIKVAAEDGQQKISGAELARRANEEARASGSFVRSGLGAGSLMTTIDHPDTSVGNGPDFAKGPAAFKIINAAPSEEATAPDAAAALPATATVVPPVQSAPKMQMAALGAGTKPAMATAKPAPKSTCKVWTASYGGSHAIIIKAKTDAQDNYTVLDVNEGTEQREAEAYIAAYAKGGQTVGTFSNTNQALDKAFELCPEG